MPDEDITIKAILHRIRGWKVQKRELLKEAHALQKRINEAREELDNMIDD